MKDKLSTIINIATIIGLAVGAYLWVEFRIDKAIVERVKPYESLLAGLSLQQNQSDDLAIAEFRKVFNGIKIGELDEVRLAAIIDPYLRSMANAERPVKYEADLQRILPLAKTKVGLRGDRHNSLGYIYLFTNRPKEAVKSFQDSIAFYSMEKESPDVGGSYWGLSLSYMALGDLKRAIENYEKAWDIDYRNYGVEDTFNYKIVENDYGKQLIKMYPKFESTITAFYNELEDTYEIKPILKRSDIKKEKDKHNNAINSDS